MITQERLKEILDYNPDTGIFTWKIQTGRRIRVGSIAGNVMESNYVRIRIDKIAYKAHRLAWLYMTGSMPAKYIDHINRVRDDNRFSNLRECTPSENQQNRKLVVTNKSGYVGVFLTKNNKFRAAITVNNNFILLGYFDTAEEASNAYKQAKLKYHTFNPIVN